MERWLRVKVHDVQRKPNRLWCVHCSRHVQLKTCVRIKNTTPFLLFIADKGGVSAIKKPIPVALPQLCVRSWLTPAEVTGHCFLKRKQGVCVRGVCQLDVQYSSNHQLYRSVLTWFLSWDMYTQMWKPCEANHFMKASCDEEWTQEVASDVKAMSMSQTRIEVNTMPLHPTASLLRQRSYNCFVRLPRAVNWFKLVHNSLGVDDESTSKQRCTGKSK